MIFGTGCSPKGSFFDSNGNLIDWNRETAYPLIVEFPKEEVNGNDHLTNFLKTVLKGNDEQEIAVPMGCEFSFMNAL